MATMINKIRQFVVTVEQIVEHEFVVDAVDSLDARTQALELLKQGEQGNVFNLTPVVSSVESL